VDDAVQAFAKGEVAVLVNKEAEAAIATLQPKQEPKVVVSFSYNKKEPVYSRRIILLMHDGSTRQVGWIESIDKSEVKLFQESYAHKLTAKKAKELLGYNEQQKKLWPKVEPVKKEHTPKVAAKNIDDPTISDEEMALATSIARAANERCTSPARIAKASGNEELALQCNLSIEERRQYPIAFHAVKIFHAMPTRLEPKEVEEARLQKETEKQEAKSDEPKEQKEKEKVAIAVDSFGSRVGSQAAAINAAAVESKTKTVDDLVKRVKLNKGRVKGHVKWLINHGFAKWENKAKEVFKLLATSKSSKSEAKETAAVARKSKDSSKSDKSNAKQTATHCSKCKKAKNKLELNVIKGKLVCDTCLDAA
jgi:hypothetical protein